MMKSRLTVGTLPGLTLVLAVTLAAPAFGAQGDIERVSVHTDGTQGNGSSHQSTISEDGRYVAFDSNANNLIIGDVGGHSDVFVRDRQAGATTRVSIDSSGTESDGTSQFPAISANGRYVAFESDATNLIVGDGNETVDVFVHDRVTGETTRVSVDSSGTEGDLESHEPAISADGRYVSFWSSATNLVADDMNGSADVFVHDRVTGETTRVSVGSGGAEADDFGSFGAAISADGRYVAFESLATNLVTGDTNGLKDVFVHDRDTGVTSRVSVDSSGTQGDGGVSSDAAISADGSYVTFYSLANNLVAGDTNATFDVFVRDLNAGTTTRLSVDSSGTQGNGQSFNPEITADGRYVSFWSQANNLVTGDTGGWNDVFVHDRLTGTTTRVSVDATGTQGNNGSAYAAISADGRYVAFESVATNLVPGDTNGAVDVFVHQYLADTPSVPVLASHLLVALAVSLGLTGLVASRRTA